MAVVELGLELGVIDGDDGEGQLVRIRHRLERAHARGGLLGDADETGQEFRPLHHEEAREVRAIVDDDVRLQVIEEPECALPLLGGGPGGVCLDGVAARGDLVSHPLVAFVGVAVHPDHGSRFAQPLDEDRRLGLDDEAARDAHAPEHAACGKVRGESRGDGHAPPGTVPRLGAGEGFSARRVGVGEVSGLGRVDGYEAPLAERGEKELPLASAAGVRRDVDV